MVGTSTLRHPRLVLLKSARTLHLFDGETLIRSYPVVLGSNPVGPKTRANDGRTPEGRYRICTKNAASPHHRFLGIDYPGHEAATWGLEHGLISAGEAAAIHQAIDAGRCPPWTTALGGAVGLHGRRGPSEIDTVAGPNRATAGCIALADGHIEELFDVLRLGDEIEILP